MADFDAQLGQLIAVLRSMNGKSVDPDARKKAEADYHSLKSNPDFLLQALLHILAQGAAATNATDEETAMTQFVAILVRQTFYTDKVLDYRVFDRCSPETKQSVTEKLLECWQKEST